MTGGAGWSVVERGLVATSIGVPGLLEVASAAETPPDTAGSARRCSERGSKLCRGTTRGDRSRPEDGGCHLGALYTFGSPDPSAHMALWTHISLFSRGRYRTTKRRRRIPTGYLEPRRGLRLDSGVARIRSCVVRLRRTARSRRRSPNTPRRSTWAAGCRRYGVPELLSPAAGSVTDPVEAPNRVPTWRRVRWMVALP